MWLFKCDALRRLHDRRRRIYTTERLTDELETYRGRKYFQQIHADPGFNAPEDFAVVVYNRDAEVGENHQIARADTSHGFTHFDKVFRRDEPKEEVDWGYGRPPRTCARTGGPTLKAMRRNKQLAHLATAANSSWQ